MENNKKLGNDNHFFFDGYSILEEELADVEKIDLFLKNINKCIFQNEGKVVLIPYFNGKVRDDGGVSGIILGDNFHFTCHTFCYKNTVFIDYFGDMNKSDDVKRLILDMFHTDDYDLCTDNKVNGNFGKHIIVKPDNTLGFDESMKMVSVILSEINMTPINDLIINKKDEEHFDILQPIAESHISFHRKNDDMFIDVFSCKDFDEKKLLGLLGEDKNYVGINRGIRYR